MNTFFKNRLEESKILFIYRYISLLLTSTFYFSNQSEHTISRKIFIILCLTIAAIILSYLYLIFENSKKTIKILLLIEIISNSILLIPSGGIKSPFIWYTLNTILISSLFLKKRYLWINILLYIFLTSSIAYLSNNYDLNILNFAKEQSSLILSIVMIIASIQVLSIYIRQTKEKSKKLEEVNEELQSANIMITESFEYINALYQSVSIFSNKGNVEGLINILFDHIKNITRTNAVFYYDISDKVYKMISKGNENIINLIEDKITSSLSEILESKTPTEIAIVNARFVAMPVGNHYQHYGILGFKVTNEKEGFVYKNNIHQIQFLSELISIALERIDLEELNDRLIISEEQNRIANEIHDSVLQRLFSMSCGVFSLIKKIPNYSTNEMIEELNQFREMTDTVMKELRDKIYGLSWKKAGQSSFITDVKKYIEDIKRFSNANIPFTIIGSIELLSCNQKRALYRIICEGIGNAVRHGKAKNIEVNLHINPEFVSLSIMDDGIGFDVSLVDANKTKGLGIQNMNQLVQSLQGEIEIDSSPGSGTSIKLAIPNNTMVLRGGESIV